MLQRLHLFQKVRVRTARAAVRAIVREKVGRTVRAILKARVRRATVKAAKARRVKPRVPVRASRQKEKASLLFSTRTM